MTLHLIGQARIPYKHCQQGKTHRILSHCSNKSGHIFNPPPPPPPPPTGNMLVCWAVCLNSTLQSITNYFVVSLAVADIAVGLLAIPFAITISTGFCANFHGCLFIACFVLVLTQSSIFSLLAIAVDRYIAIKSPLRFALCWLPLHIINCFNLFCQDCGRPHVWVMNIAIILSHANSVVNPFIYAYRIREFRHTFRRILRKHILGHWEGHGAGGGGGRGLGSSSSITRASTRISMVDSSCGTMGNSYSLESSPKPSPTRTPIETHRAGKEAYSDSCQWSPQQSDPAPISSIENGHNKGDAPVSPRQQQCIMGCADQSGVETTTVLMEVKDSGNISFVHVRPLSPTLTSPNHSVELTEVS
ncbi:adenosine receptor A2a-like [Oncorhynchus clarkii lewisi]|uniref:adenosine receptor A2a-like n=1 Tax=Oncorhynchus clarkii lewisi TaxID=490388 RepID=UPI0039B85FC4